MRVATNYYYIILHSIHIEYTLQKPKQQSIMSSATATTTTLNTTPREEGEVRQVDLDNVSTTSNAPVEVAADMDNGLESVSCKLANAFYERYGASLHGLTKRGALSQFYIDTYESWCPEELKGQPRHFKQVLFALAFHTKKVRVVGGGRFLRWTDFQPSRNHRGGGRRRGGSRDYSDRNSESDERHSGDDRRRFVGRPRRHDDGYRQQRRRGGSRDYSDRRQGGRGSAPTITDDLIDRIAARLSERN